MRGHLRGYTMDKAAEISPSSGSSPNASAIQRPAGLWIACCSQIGRWPRRHGDAHPVHSAIITERIKVSRANVGPVDLLSIQPLCREPHSLSSNGPLIRGVDHRHVLDIGYQPLELVGGFPERVLGVADAELDRDRLAVLVGHPEGDRGGSPLLIDRSTGRVSDYGIP